MHLILRKEESMGCKGYKKIPLGEQLEKVNQGIVHPEYAACAIRAWADTPISAYLGGDTEKGRQRRDRLWQLLGPPAAGEAAMTYRHVVEYICFRMQTGEATENAKRLLAEPLAEGYEKWKEECRDAESAT